MELSRQAKTILERILVGLLLGISALAVWQQFSSPLLQQLTARTDDTAVITIRTDSPLQVAYNPATQKARVTMLPRTPGKNKAKEEDSSAKHLFFTPKQRSRDTFWENFKQGLSSWRYNPLQLPRAAWGYITARYEKRTNLSVAEFILLAMELSQLEVNDFTVTSPVPSKTKKDALPPSANPLVRAPLAVQDRPIIVEILNASGQKGLALALTQYLREQNAKGLLRVDVLQYDNYPSQQKTSWLEDYSGRQIQLKQLGSAVGITGEIRTGTVPNVICDTRIILGQDFKMPL